MRTSRLPVKPMEDIVLKGLTGFIIKFVCRSAEIFGFWKLPSKKAAADILDMSLLDKIYWVYKSLNPIVQPEKDNPLKKGASDSYSFQLPDGFEKGEDVTIGAVGDMMKVGGLEHSKDFLYEKVADLIFENDIVYGNFESQLTEQEIVEMVFKEDESPELCCTQEQYEALKSHRGKNYTVFHTACNHTMDKGMEGLQTTLKHLQADQIMDIGTNLKPEDQDKGKIVDVNGIRIGFVSATFGLNGRTVPAGEEYRVNVAKLHNPNGPADVSLLQHQIADCQQQNCDFIIASLHWGFEYEFFPRTDQVQTTHLLVEAGVDAIISHHPHVIQPVEVYQTKRDPDRLAVIAYSLGNLTSPYSAPPLALSQILNLSLNKGTFKDKSRTYIDSYLATPVVQTESENQGKPAIQPVKVSDVNEMDDCPLEQSYLEELNTYVDLVQGEFRVD
jgi:poly-gamma-glutamate capsule biosynthesis protein CapA/YwtB (metallophosphatase superfamily)